MCPTFIILTSLLITKGAKLTRSTIVSLHYHFFCPPRKFKAESPCWGLKSTYLNSFSGNSWLIKYKPQNSLPRPVLTYHFLVQIGALEHSSSFRVWLRSKICPKNFLAVKKTYNLKLGWHAPHLFPDQTHTMYIVYGPLLKKRLNFKLLEGTFACLWRKNGLLPMIA